jgi:hypothetical protein
MRIEGKTVEIEIHMCKKEDISFPDSHTEALAA